MTSLDSGSIGVKTHNSELYFETKDLDAIIKKLDECKREIEFVQKIIKHP